MREIKLAVFDMAGTTVNEDNIVYKTVQKSLMDAGYEVSLEMVLENGAGKEKRNAIADVLRKLNGQEPGEEKVDVIFEAFKQGLKTAYETLNVTSYEGVEELFAYLRSKDIKVVLNTGYDRKTAQGLIDKLGWQIGKDIDDMITADDVKIGRPTAEMIELAMQRFSIDDPSKVLKAGDSAIDIEEGKNANCGLTIGVLTGAQTKEQLQQANPTYIWANLAELKKMV